MYVPKAKKLSNLRMAAVSKSLYPVQRATAELSSVSLSLGYTPSRTTVAHEPWEKTMVKATPMVPGSLNLNDPKSCASDGGRGLTTEQTLRL